MKSSDLIRMANQIARFFASQSHDAALAGTAEHLRLFWSPPMIADLAGHLAKDSAGVDPLVIKAIAELTKEKTAAPP